MAQKLVKKVKDLMTKGVGTARPDDTLQKAARQMEQLDVGPLPVVENDVVVGILTDRDITVRAVAAGCDPKQTAVREAMTTELVCCHPEEDIQSAVLRMEECEVRRLPVLDRDNHLVGMVALADLARHATPREATQALKGVSQPS
jgi:CBS domain-containing protein